MPTSRARPELPELIRLLAKHRVNYVVTGSTAALLHGVDLIPGDLDVTPARDAPNLARLAVALESIDARPDPEGPFGDWRTGPDGEHRWVERDPLPGERESRLHWRPDPHDPGSFDTLLVTRLGALDVVPEISGRFEDLAQRATEIEAFGIVVLAAGIADQLATLTVPRRDKDRARVASLRELQRRASDEVSAVATSEVGD